MFPFTFTSSSWMKTGIPGSLESFLYSVMPFSGMPSQKTLFFRLRLTDGSVVGRVPRVVIVSEEGLEFSPSCAPWETTGSEVVADERGKGEHDDNVVVDDYLEGE